MISSNFVLMDIGAFDNMANIWIAISNTPHVLFFHPLINELEKNHSTNLTYNSRGETRELLMKLELDAKNLGHLNSEQMSNIFYVGWNLLKYIYKIPKFDFALSFENVAPIPITKIRDKEMILFLDNDIKYFSNKSFVQNVRNKISCFCKNIVVPNVCIPQFSKIYKTADMFAYDGYKEHIHISNFTPDKKFLSELPFNEYVALRPESLSSLYVQSKETMIPKLLENFEKKNINIIYLPRGSKDKQFARGYENVYIPPSALNGLDLTYHARATLTGSGTMAREAAVLGTPAVSFFPGERLLSVDQDIVNKKKMLHSRDPEEIVDYVISNWNKKKKPEFEKAKKTKKEVIEIINKIIEKNCD